MRTSRIIVAAVMVLIGLGWVGQGSGMLPGTAMSGSPFWAAVGVILVIGGVVIGAREVARRSASPH